MKIYLMRHCEAEEGPQLDPTRKLTDLGKKQARMMGKWLSRQVEQPDLVIESNMRRSQQTAKRVADHIDADIVRCGALDPDAQPEDAISEMQRLGADVDSVIAVTHGPLVEEIIATLTDGKADQFHFAHGSVAHFDSDGTLHWFVSPNTVARDEDEMDAVTNDSMTTIEAAVQVAQCCVGIVESLQHPRHAAALTPQRAKFKRMLMRRWRRQLAQLRKAPGLDAFLRTRNIEADVDLRARLQSSVEAHINGTGVLGVGDERDSAAYDRIVSGTMNAAVTQMSVDYQIQIAKEIGQKAVADYLMGRGFDKLAADIDATTRDQLAAALTDVFEAGGTYEDAVAALEGPLIDAARADTIARTELNAAYNESMLASAREIPGALKEWSPDGECCEAICQPNVDEGPIALDDDFPSGDDAPPAHPNAVLAGSTFNSYGGLKRMVSGEYDSLSISLHAGEYHTTIGPNHPMLTTRGLIAAKLLNIGDHLICDSRPIDKNMGVSESDLYEIALVEQAFASLSGRFSHSVVTGSSYDFHGDSVSNEKEIEVIFPEGKLLIELDPFGLENLGKIPLMLTDVELESKARSGAFSENLDRIFLPSSGSMGGSGVSHYLIRSIQDIRIVPFKGRCFDATTAIGLYCSDGFVVSNCDCSISFVLPGGE